MTLRNSLTTAACAVTLTAVGACADSPTQPVKEATSPTRISASVASGSALDFSHELDDIRTRSLPSFTSQEAADSLQAEMNTISERVAAGDLDGAKAAIARAREVVQLPGTTSPVDAYAIVRTLDMIETVLQQ